MSGHKRTTITISEAEYRRLCEADRQSHLFQEQLPLLLEKARQEVRQSLLAEAQQSRQRQHSFQELLVTFDEEFRQTESDNSRLWLETQEAILRRLRTVEETAQENLTSLQEALHRQMEALAEVQQEAAERLSEQQQRLSELEQTSGWMLADEARKAQIALRWLQHAEALYHFIQNHYEVERFAPGQLDAAAARLRQAYLNLEDGFCEAVLAEGQQMYRQLSELRLSLEQMQNEWLTLRASLLSGYRFLLDLAEKQQFVQAVDLEGNLQPERVEVDAWTSGALTRFVQRIEQILNTIEADPPDLGLQTLRRLMKEDLPARENELSEIVFQARLEVLNSQLRVNIADLTVRALQEQGFVPVQTRFQANDMRRAYQVRLVNLEGAEVIVKIDPDPQDYGRNDLHLFSRDQPLRTEHELWQRAQVIQNALQQYGLALGGMVEVPLHEPAAAISTKNPQPAVIRQAGRTIHRARQHHER